ncbi:attachment glycoprotein [Jingmen Miniopterus schreibersii paramyxovirus 2]|nr:attachment glycoprotein [Jingmen Miniopterus schreibersii paramyxovirus 2]
MATSPSQKYYNSNSKSGEKYSTNGEHQGATRWSQYGTFITSTLSLVSILVLLVLNLTSLIKLYKDQGNTDQCKPYFHKVATTVNEMQQDIVAEIKPKLNLISSAASFQLPNMIANVENNVLAEITRSCNFDGIQFPNTTCNPQGTQVFHSPSFSLINTDLTDSCIADGGEIKVEDNTTFLNYPSFIPGATTPGGCIRIPSFSLSSTIFSYTQNVVLKGCDDFGKSYQTWMLGHIGTSYQNTPEPRATQTWDMGSNINRKSCSTASGTDYAWLGCTIVTEKEKEDYASPGIQQITIAYQNLRGTKKEWTYSQDDINFENNFAAMYFSVGSGIVVDGRVIFLVYGGLIDRYGDNSYCEPQGCDSYTQEQCNSADTLNFFSKRQIVNALLIFQDDPSSKPAVVVKTISPQYNWIGAEGRLFYNPVTKEAYIYTRSSGWHTQLQIGKISLESPYEIRWTPYTSVTRPGSEGCHAENKCPKPCLTGVYSDAFPLTSNLELVITAVHNHRSERKKPRVESAKPDAVTGYKDIYTNDQGASYTTTTCFGFGIDIWCLSIIEIPFGVQSAYTPVPFLYKLKSSCPKKTWWSVLTSTTYLKLLTPLFTHYTRDATGSDGIVTTPPPLPTHPPSSTKSTSTATTALLTTTPAKAQGSAQG